MNSEQLLRAVFSCFHVQKLNFLNFFLHCRVRTKKLLDTKVKNKKIGKYFGGVKNCFFRASCFGFIVKGVHLLLLPLVSLITPSYQVVSSGISGLIEMLLSSRLEN